MSDFDFKSTEFELKGFKDLYRALDQLPPIVKKKELEPILVHALEPMAEFARTMAPDDPLTGPPWNLPTSIDVSVRQRTGRSKSDRDLGRFDARAYMGPTKFGYPQAIMQEFGTVHSGAQAYMRPAWDSQKQVALDTISRNLAARLEAVIRKYGVKR